MDIAKCLKTAKEKARVNELSAMLQGWKADVGAQAMKPNPQFKGR